ncbi:methylesterase 17-like isoform X2 [Spinacia oleracea]|uniref:Methylesterase 17-like isoform X2 n=1 Tax=Spinacia oleracea TaxID=3562 RepID=A0ABM3R4D1_SPIOL|nr:methylesterase 17-like isoform X2 [Spinacia oleracea]
MTITLSAHFVLIHGAGYGGWCWYKIRCLLESTGQKVSCPDLSCSGIDLTDVDTIRSFQDYNKPLDDILASLPEGEKVILVGHSAGGLSVTKAIQNFPDKIQVGVFIGAVMLRNGFQTEQDRKDDCTLAKMLQRTIPSGALSGAVFPEGKDSKSNNVPRVYIKTMHDNVFSRKQQDVMIKRWPPHDVYSIDSDHFPMFSNPSHLFGLLLRVAAKFECF